MVIFLLRQGSHSHHPLSFGLGKNLAAFSLIPPTVSLCLFTFDIRINEILRSITLKQLQGAL